MNGSVVCAVKTLRQAEFPIGELVEEPMAFRVVSNEEGAGGHFPGVKSLVEDNGMIWGEELFDETRRVHNADVGIDEENIVEGVEKDVQDAVTAEEKLKAASPERNRRPCDGSTLLGSRCRWR